MWGAWNSTRIVIIICFTLAIPASSSIQITSIYVVAFCHMEYKFKTKTNIFISLIKADKLIL